MAKDRQAPCVYYICKGSCKKGRKAEHSGYCQHCDKYVARKGFKYIDKRYKKLNDINKKEINNG